MNRHLVPSLALAAACAITVLSACGSQVAGPPASPASSSPASSSTASSSPARTVSAARRAAGPRQRAAADAARIIAAFRRPPGAVRSGLIASLNNPVVEVGTADVVTATRWWRVPGQPRAVLSWISAHLPAGFTPDGSGSGTFRNSTGALVESLGDTFALSPVPGVLPQRELVVTAMPYRGQTALRTDAQVAWLPARPAAERIPAGVRAVTVTPVFGSDSDRRGDRLDHAFTVTDPAKLARIVALANALTVYPAGAYVVPGQLRRRDAARLPGPPGRPGAGPVLRAVRRVRRRVRQHRRAEPARAQRLDGLGAMFQDRVLAIAGVRWPHQPGAPAGTGN